MGVDVSPSIPFSSYPCKIVFNGGTQTKLVQCPDGEVQKRKVIHRVSFHEIDVISSQRGYGIRSIPKSRNGARKGRYTCQKVLVRCQSFFCLGLLIGEVHMLEIECFSFLNRALEGELAPLVIMGLNRGLAHIRGTKFRSPHGLPMDLLDWVLIVSTKPYSEDDIQQIIQIRPVDISFDIFLPWSYRSLRFNYF